MQSESGYHFISDFLTCQQKFYWQYIEGLIPKRVPKALLFGDSIHKALAEYYSDKWKGFPPNELESETIKKFQDSLSEVRENYQNYEDFNTDLERGVRLINEYFISRTYEKIAKKEVEVYKELKLPSGRVITGNIDLICNFHEGYSVIYDHKTTGWAIPLTVRSLRMSNQATTYLALCPEATSLVYNILYQNKSTCAFHREIIYKTPQDINRWINQADEILEEISAKVGQPQDKWWRNDKSCFSYNHTCEYVDLCQCGKSHLTLNNFKYREKEER